MRIYDCIVIGAGHAGCEAALACARTGLDTLMLAISADSIAFMPCNPSIGGTSKGHLVREVDALGGQMGITADSTAMQMKMLNTSKGPAVHSLRAQSDKLAYQNMMRSIVEGCDGLTVRQGEAVDIEVEDGRVRAVITAMGDRYECRTAVLATGVYMDARIITGEYSRNCGPNGLLRSEGLADSLRRLGLPLQRFKTGTPARLDGRSIDYGKMEPQYGAERLAFSFMTKEAPVRNVPCYLTYTNKETHKIILENLHRAPMYSGSIKGTGARYCPSIEDKVVRFADKERHQLFLEPEGDYTSEMYLQGLSTSLPSDVQERMIHTIEGLENARIVRPGYAIEYECLDPLCLDATLAVKGISGLFSAGQINGSSGYEEAAAQGLVAGLNASALVRGIEPLVLSRSQSYIGVLIDDLVTKGTKEPYRMMTSRAEFRLSLRQDNADLRLTEMGYRMGLASKERLDATIARKERIAAAARALESCHLSMSQVNTVLTEPADRGMTAKELLKRSDVQYTSIAAVAQLPELDEQDVLTLETDIKYEGYLQKQQSLINEMVRLEAKKLPQEVDYTLIKGLRIEGAQKLNAIRPVSLGQASRISGVSPADIAVLMVWLEKNGENK